MAAASTPKGKIHNVAQFVGHPGTERHLTVADQDGLIGVPGIAKKDLVWPAGGRAKLDITDVHEAVLEYIKGDPEFKVTEVEAPTAG